MHMSVKHNTGPLYPVWEARRPSEESKSAEETWLAIPPSDVYVRNWRSARSSHYRAKWIGNLRFKIYKHLLKPTVCKALYYTWGIRDK